MNCVTFKFKHFKELHDMLTAQACPWQGTVKYQTLPKIGYITILGDQPVAAGFLRRLEGGYAQLDTFVTNPYLGSLIRNQGLDMVVNSLMSEAKDLDLLGILAVTEDQGILTRAKERGFKVIPQTLLGILLK
jgi:hypothetical protein